MRVMYNHVLKLMIHLCCCFFSIAVAELEENYTGDYRAACLSLAVNAVTHAISMF